MTNEITNRNSTRTSLEIANFLGVRHADILKDIRKMEPIWEEVSGGKFSLTSYYDRQNKERPCYELTLDQTLFVTSKYDDRQRALLIKRWSKLEQEETEEERVRAIGEAIFQTWGWDVSDPTTWL